jgi:hypothetical protein
MRLSDIFSLSCFRSPEERKAADLDKLGRRLRALGQDRLETMLENEMERADLNDREPSPVRIDMVFRNLQPRDITRDALRHSGGVEFLEFLAEDVDAKLAMTVTPETIRPLFGLGAATTGARLSIVVDLSRPWAESVVSLGDDSGAVNSPAAPAPPKP